MSCVWCDVFMTQIVLYLIRVIFVKHIFVIITRWLTDQSVRFELFNIEGDLNNQLLELNKMDLGNNFVITNCIDNNKCTAMLINYSFHCRKISVGQSITSQIFEMTLPHIGKSKWTLILFLNGQYDEFQRDDGQLSVYLKMVSCENENEQLLVDVKFFLDAEEIYNKVLVSSTFNYKNVRTRWIGAKLISKSDLRTQASCGCLVKRNNLIIGFRFIHPVTLYDDFKTMLQLPSKEIEPKQMKSWSSTPLYSNSTVIEVYRPETSSSSSNQAPSDGLQNDKIKSEFASNASIPASITSSITSKEREKPRKKRRLLCW